MSFIKHKTSIEEGDTVVLYLTINNIHTIDVTEKITNKKGEVIEYIFQVISFILAGSITDHGLQICCVLFSMEI
jgi:hypothetical protein